MSLWMQFDSALFPKLFFTWPNISPYMTVLPVKESARNFINLCRDQLTRVQRIVQNVHTLGLPQKYILELVRIREMFRPPFVRNEAH